MPFSLHRKSGSPYWYAFFRIPDPDSADGWRQTSKSTRRTRKADAEIEARELEEIAKREAGAGSVRSRELFKILSAANDMAVSGDLNEMRARQFLSKILELSTGHPLQVYSLRRYLDDWLEDKSKANSKGTYLHYKGVIEDFLDHLPESRTEGNLMNLTGVDVRSFRDVELASGKAASTVNDAVKTVRTALNKARRDGLIFTNPAEAVELIAEEKIEKTTFTPGAIRSLLKVAEGDWQGLILAGYFTGANLRDITDLRWENIDLSSETIAYTRRKTGAAVTLPLHPNLLSWLLERPTTDDPKAPVFPSLLGKSTAGKSGLSMKFRRLMDKAEIVGDSVAAKEVEGRDGVEKPKTKGRTRNALSFHSLRHSFNSAMANAGVLQETRLKLTGHSSAAMNKVYTHHELDTLRAAIASVPSINDSKESE